MGTNSKEYGKAWYQANREKRILQIKADQNKKRLFIRDYKEARGCMDCGNSFPYFVLELDHRDPKTKLINPADMVRQGWGLDKIKAELDKCDVVCANCHRFRTHQIPI